MFETDLLKVKVPQAFAVVFFLQGALVAPMWFIFQFQPLLFKSTDLLKLVFLSLAIGVPIHIFNSMLVATKALNDIFIEVKGDWTIEIALMSCLSLSVLYLPCCVSFFHTLTFRQAVWISIGLEIFYAFVAWLAAKAVKTQAKKLAGQ